MNRNLWIAAALLCASPLALAQATPPPAAEIKQQAQPWKSIPIPPLPAFHPSEPKRIQLKNGVVIFLEEDHELPFISGSISIKGGERDVPADKAGLTDLYSDAWRNSGTATKNGDQLDDILEAKAAKVETSGDVDSTGVSWTCLKADEDLVFGIAVDLLEHPKFDDQKLNLAKQQAATSIVRRNDEAAQIAGREAAQLVYGKTNPYAREPEIATVTSVTVADLQKFHDKTVVPNNILIGVTGDFDSAVMEQKLRAAFEGLPRGTPAPAAPIKFSDPKPAVYFVDKNDVNQSNVWIVGLGTERNNPDYFALSMMNEIFSGGFGSRLFQNVRTKLGLAYSVGGAYGASYDHPGMFHVSAATKSESTVAAIKAIQDQINALKTQPFTELELQNAKDQLLNSFIFQYDSKEKVLAARTRYEFYGYPADYLEKYRAGIEKVTIADLSRVAKKYVDTSKLAILVVGNVSEFGTPLTALDLGQPQPLDITIPMPPGMGEQLGGKGQE